MDASISISGRVSVVESRRVNEGDGFVTVLEVPALAYGCACRKYKQEKQPNNQVIILHDLRPWPILTGDPVACLRRDDFPALVSPKTRIEISLRG
jgi:hypothetical protein